MNETAPIPQGQQMGQSTQPGAGTGPEAFDQHQQDRRTATAVAAREHAPPQAGKGDERDIADQGTLE